MNKMFQIVLSLVILLRSDLAFGQEVVRPGHDLFRVGYDNEEPLLYDTFPEDFLWGVATASYQVS